MQPAEWPYLSRLLQIEADLSKQAAGQQIPVNYMNFFRWLRLALRELRHSTDDIGSHLYANYRYMRRDGSLQLGVVRQFERYLAAASSLVSPADDVAGYMVQRAASGQFTGAGPYTDFRLMGDPIYIAQDALFVTVNQSRIGSVSTTSDGAKPLTSHPVAASTPGSPDEYYTPQQKNGSNVLWVTRADALLARLAATKPTTPQDLFTQLANILGLKPKYGSWSEARKAPWDVLTTIRLFRAVRPDKLSRPHALSGGYSDRFLGRTVFMPYGATAECSTGVPCLPEAIATIDMLAEILPSDTRYDDFCAQIGAIDPNTVRHRITGQPLEATIKSNAFEPLKGYLALQAAILSQL